MQTLILIAIGFLSGSALIAGAVYLATSPAARLRKARLAAARDPSGGGTDAALIAIAASSDSCGSDGGGGGGD